jgi:excinuclease UvrABC nuclease subunit
LIEVTEPHTTILDHTLDFDPAASFEEFLSNAPAKWVVYLLADADDCPVQLLCVKNLRYSLKRRLGGEETIGLSKRVNYRELIRKIYWRRVDSAFEADWVYLHAARKLFPQTYQGMVGLRPAWFIHVNPETNFPRYTKTIDPTGKTGVLLGPIEDKHAAGRLIEEIEDAFDLCRYYNILVMAPNARACAYKEMGKCPAPCDGSISMPQYRRMVEWSAQVAVAPAEFLREQTRRMQSAAAELRFETAAKIKTYIDQISQFGKGPFRYVRRLEDFIYFALQRGPREGTAKIFLITPGRVEELAGLISETTNDSSLLRHLLECAEQSPRDLSSQGVEDIGVVAYHLFSAKQTHGVFIPLHAIDDKSLAKAFRDLKKQKSVEETIESEGVVKELQSMGESS